MHPRPVVKTFTDLGQFDPNAESADFSQFNSLEEDSLDAFLAFEPEQLQNLAKDGSGSADLSRLDDIATQAKFTKAFIEAGQSFEAAENFVDGAGFDPDVFAGFEFEDIKTAVSANADGVNTDPDAFFGAIDLDQIKSTAEVVKDLGEVAPLPANYLLNSIVPF